MAKKKSPKRALALFLIYLTIITCLALGVFYYVADKMAPMAIAVVIIGSFVAAGIATIVHLRTGMKNAIDGVIDRMP